MRTKGENPVRLGARLRRRRWLAAALFTTLPWTASALIPLIEPDARIERAAESLRDARAGRGAEQALVRLTRDRDEEVRAAASA